MLTFRAKYVKDKTLKRRELPIVWCLHLCIFSQDVGYKSDLSLDEHVQICRGAFILLNGPFRWLDT